MMENHFLMIKKISFGDLRVLEALVTVQVAEITSIKEDAVEEQGKFLP